MVWSNKRTGVGAASLQALAVALFCVLLMQKTGVDHPIGKFLLRSSVWLVLGSAMIAMIGLLVDKKKLFALISLLLVLPILTLMGMLQGFW